MNGSLDWLLRRSWIAIPRFAGYRGLVGIVAFAAAVGVRAQTLAERVAVASRGDSAAQIALAAHLRTAPLGALVDELAPLLPGLRSSFRMWLLSALEERSTAIHALWRAEPERRRARAAVFAHLLRGWQGFYGRTDAAERADLEVLAAFTTPALHHPALSPFDPAERLATIEQLQRLAARGHSTLSPQEAALLFGFEGDGLDTARMIHGSVDWGGPFAFREALTAPDERVRARALAAVANRLGCELPPWVIATLATDPLPPVRLWQRRWGATPLPNPVLDRDVPGIVEALAADRMPTFWSDTQTVTAASRRQLYQAFVAAGTRAAAGVVPAADCSVLSMRMLPPNAAAAASAAVGFFRRAARLGGAQAGSVLALAWQAPTAGGAWCVLEALDDPYVELPRGSTSVLGVMLDDPRELIAETAARVVVRVPREIDPALRDRANAMALEALQSPDVQLGLHLIPSPCGLGGPGLGAPCNKASWLVRGAALDGAVALVPHLIARSKALLAEQKILVDGRTHHVATVAFALQCLALLAPKVGPVDAKVLFDGLAVDELATEPRAGITSPERGFSIAILVGLRTTVPTLVESVGAKYPAVAARLKSQPPFRLPSDRFFPEPPRSYARVAAKLREPEARDRPAGLAYWASSTIGEVNAGDPAADLAALRELCASTIPMVAVAAAVRIATLEPQGADIARETLDRLRHVTDLEQLALVVRAALELGIEPRDWRAAAEALRTGRYHDPTVLAAALEFRFGGRPARDANASQLAALMLARIDLDTPTLAAILGDHTLACLPNTLQQARSPVTARAALELAKVCAAWDDKLEAAVVPRILDPDAGVRLAAYEALGSRDPEVWPCALLAHAADFDPDPAVRAFARSLSR
jgi:hypothetical protein